MQHRPTFRDRLPILAAALLFSTGGVAIKWTSLGGMEVAGLRALVAAAAIWFLVPGPARMGGRAVFLTGVAQGAAMLLFVLANKLTTAANTIFLQSAAPLYVPLLASRFLGEKATGRDFAAMAGIACGLSLFFVDAGDATATAPNPRLGDLLAIASGVAWAGTVIGLRLLARDGGGGHVAVVEAGVEAILSEAGDDTGKDAPPSRLSTDRGRGAVQAEGAAKGALLWGNLLVAGGTLPFFAFSLGGMAWSDAAVLLYLGSAQVALAYRCLVSGVRRVPALEASLLILFEPVLNPLWAWLLLGEAPGGWSLGGAAIIAAVTAVRAFAGERREA